MSIPANQIVTVNPSVLNAGGSALDLNGMFLTPSTRLPLNVAVPFPDAPSVGSYFGLLSPEYAAANAYFPGFRNSTKKPALMVFVAYAAVPAAGFVRGARLPYVSLLALQAMSGTLVITVAGNTFTSANINLSSATSFSAAAALITAAFTAPTFTVTFDSLSNAFLATTGATGSAATITSMSGTLADSLALSTDYGAVTSQGSAADTPPLAMIRAVGLYSNWATFTTLFEPSKADKLGFSFWTTGQGNRYLYLPWDTDSAATVAGSTTCFAYALKFAQYAGVAPVYFGLDKAAFLMGAIASLDFTRRNGRATMAFRGQDGLTPDVTDGLTAQALTTNGYNFYGAYATANDQFNFSYPGRVSGQFQWIDSYVNQIWMNNQFQLALMNLLAQAYSIPYNADGYNTIIAALLDPIGQALNFGAIRAGVTLSSLQKSFINSGAGLQVDNIVSQQGWYLQVVDASPQTRQARQSPAINFWYADGESIQQLNLASILVQ